LIIEEIQHDGHSSGADIKVDSKWYFINIGMTRQQIKAMIENKQIPNKQKVDYLKSLIGQEL